MEMPAKWMGGWGLVRVVAAVAIVYVSGKPAPAQSSSLAAGTFLVASVSVSDPNFAETVVVLIHHDDRSWAGLIINRRTKAPISNLFPNLKGLKGGADPLHAGGPVGKPGVLALLRSRTNPQGARRVFGDVSLISSKGLLDKALSAGTEPGTFRVYFGYSGWTRGRLEKELDLGVWHVMRGEADLVFDPDPGSVWRRLIQRTELRIATTASKHHDWLYTGLCWRVQNWNR